MLELRPHLLLEGMLIAMRSLDAPEGYIYLREEYATRATRLERAIAELRAAGLLNGRSLELVVGAGAYIAGEETAMLESMEGRRAMPRLKPPFPSEVGYLGRPTLINNVETLAHVPAILRAGGASWSPVSALVGDRSGRASPAATRRRSTSRRATLIDEYAGGATDEIGAIVPGRRRERNPPAGGARRRRSPRDALGEWGAGPGSAALQVFPASYPVLRLLAETMRFFAEESCQKCTPCRIGNARASPPRPSELDEGKVVMTRERTEEWLEAMARTSICGLGQGVPLPVRSAFRCWPELFTPLGEAVGA